MCGVPAATEARVTEMVILTAQKRRRNVTDVKRYLSIAHRLCELNAGVTGVTSRFNLMLKWP